METASGRPATLATWPWNKFGYGWEFDARGGLGDLRINFEAVAAMWLEMDRQGRARGIALGRIIITPEFVPLVLATPSGRLLGPLEPLITRKPVWVRQDEHFHVDFVELATVVEQGGGPRGISRQGRLRCRGARWQPEGS